MIKLTLFRSILLASICAVFASCASTPVEPGTKQATYGFGVYTSYLPGNVNHNFRATNRALDDLRIFRTGQRPGEHQMEVHARTVGDSKVVVTLKPTTDGDTQISINFGNFGDQEESIRIYQRIREMSQNP